MSKPSRLRPARANTAASITPSLTLRNRVSTLPRKGTMSSPDSAARSWTPRLSDDVPTLLPGASSARRRPSRVTTTSSGSLAARNAAYDERRSELGRHVLSTNAPRNRRADRAKLLDFLDE
jgi:hypothetical protein